MAKCEFANWVDLGLAGSTHLGGPAKIVHHTTEGSTASGAFDAFRANRSTPHFTVDSETIYQHIDTDRSAYSLKNLAGGVQTNRDGAIQIEVVGFAHLPKGSSTLRNVARLCRWIEANHGVPRTWPNGHPKPANGMKDPGHHNRNATNWNTQSGHYGHCHVPENSHWDPAYLPDEVTFIMTVGTDEARIHAAMLESLDLPEPTSLKGVESTMPDHNHVQSDHDDTP